ncbi:MAG: hypothetical protein JW946_01995 [Candidatus Omnitrophica bacterium]|nr:hypothetical protein [Candidatus Omnitrophota bacterium]
MKSNKGIKVVLGVGVVLIICLAVTGFNYMMNIAPAYNSVIGYRQDVDLARPQLEALAGKKLQPAEITTGETVVVGNQSFTPVTAGSAQTIVVANPTSDMTGEDVTLKDGTPARVVVVQGDIETAMKQLAAKAKETLEFASPVLLDAEVMPTVRNQALSLMQALEDDNILEGLRNIDADSIFKVGVGDNFQAAALAKNSKGEMVPILITYNQGKSDVVIEELNKIGITRDILAFMAILPEQEQQSIANVWMTAVPSIQEVYATPAALTVAANYALNEYTGELPLEARKAITAKALDMIEDLLLQTGLPVKAPTVADDQIYYLVQDNRQGTFKNWPDFYAYLRNGVELARNAFRVTGSSIEPITTIAFDQQVDSKNPVFTARNIAASQAEAEGMIARSVEHILTVVPAGLASDGLLARTSSWKSSTLADTLIRVVNGKAVVVSTQENEDISGQIDTITAVNANSGELTVVPGAQPFAIFNVGVDRPVIISVVEPIAGAVRIPTNYTTPVVSIGRNAQTGILELVGIAAEQTTRLEVVQLAAVPTITKQSEQAGFKVELDTAIQGVNGPSLEQLSTISNLSIKAALGAYSLEQVAPDLVMGLVAEQPTRESLSFAEPIQAAHAGAAQPAQLFSSILEPILSMRSDAKVAEYIAAIEKARDALIVANLGAQGLEEDEAVQRIKPAMAALDQAKEAIQQVTTVEPVVKAQLAQAIDMFNEVIRQKAGLAIDAQVRAKITSLVKQAAQNQVLVLDDEGDFAQAFAGYKTGQPLNAQLSERLGGMQVVPVSQVTSENITGKHVVVLTNRAASEVTSAHANLLKTNTTTLLSDTKFFNVQGQMTDVIEWARAAKLCSSYTQLGDDSAEAALMAMLKKLTNGQCILTPDQLRSQAEWVIGIIPQPISVDVPGVTEDRQQLQAIVDINV